MALSEDEKQDIINSVLSSIRTNSRTIEQLTPVTSLGSTDYFEINGGKRVSYTILKELIESGCLTEHDTIRSLMDKLKSDLSSNFEERLRSEAEVRKDADEKLAAAILVIQEEIKGGMVQCVSWEEYHAMENPWPNTLYIIMGKDGSTEGAFINGASLNTGECFCFFREGNEILYGGNLGVLPRVRIDYETMEAKVDYPSDYRGPLLMTDAESKTLYAT